MRKHILEAERMARTATVPEDWTIEPMAGTGYVVVTAALKSRPMATIDVGARVVRLGFTTIGEVACTGDRPTGGVPMGRGWQQRLVHAAVAKLQEVARG